MCNCHSPDSGSISRRDTIRRLALGAGALTIGALLGDQLAHAASSDTLNDPGSALTQAKRVGRPRREFELPPPGMIVFPVEPKSNVYVLNNFGDCRDGGSRAHAGVDILAAGGGNAVYAVVNGVVTQRYTNTGTAGWGWTIEDPKTAVSYRYFHLAADALGWVTGMPVRIGDILGYVGNSGTDSATNFHLHFEVRPNNIAVDPLPLLYYDKAVIKTAPTKLNACLGKPMF
jgi:murein DD-endopeptidase MepM/ murein hydrolase activator NlpD